MLTKHPSARCKTLHNDYQSKQVGRNILMMPSSVTQWTTDEDLTEAIRSVGISDVLEIKFFENRANGQSKG